MPTFQFVGQYQGRSSNVGALRYVNLFPHATQDNRVVLFGTPGLSQLAALGPLPIRGQLVMGDYLYVVSFQTLYQIDSTMTATAVGTLSTNVGNVSMAHNGQQLMIVDGTFGYIYTPKPYVLTAVSIANAGAGYAVNDILTVSGGVYGTQSQIKVTGVSGGVIAGISIQTAGAYATAPTNPLSVTGGTGTGATFTGTFTATAKTPGVFTKINTVAANFPVADTVCFLDGYFIVNAHNTNTYFYSALYDGLTWDALDYNAAESAPDNVVAVASTFGFLYVFGSDTTEIWYDAGDPLTVFRRADGMVTNVGLLAQFSIAKIGETGNVICWLGTTPQGRGFAVANSGGGQTQRISTPEVEYQWAQYSTLSDAVGYGYMTEGHTFYVLNFPTANATWVYDFTTQTWHERSYNDGRHLSQNYAFFNNNHVVGSYIDGTLYRMHMDTYDDAGTPIQRTVISPTLGDDDTGLVSYQSFQVDMERGVGIPTGQGSDPQVMLSWSDDAGHTWCDEIMGGFGSQGVYDLRVIFRRLGRSFRRTFKLRISDPVKVVILSAVVKTE